MTILHIGPSKLPLLFPRGGATERRMRELAIRQAAAGARVILYSADDHSATGKLHGAEIRSIHCRARGALRAIEFMTRALRDARSLHPDVIHFHSESEGAALAQRFDCAKVLSYDYFAFRRGKKNLLHPLYRRALGKFTCLMPVSEYCLRESAAYWSLKPERLQVVYNGVSLQQFFPDSAAGRAQRLRAGIRHDEFVLLYVGRVCHQKGTDLLIEAAAQLRSEGRKVRAVVAGPIGQFGNDGGSDLTARLEEIGGIYLGAVDESILPAVYNLCDAFVMPTRTYEMFGMAAIEAQACGKPVVCSNHGGLPEVISSESGLLFNPGDADSLAGSLRRLMEDASLRHCLAQSAVRNARRFSWESIVSRLDTLYKLEPIGGRASARAGLQPRSSLPPRVESTAASKNL
jgi:glycosyltransferase involved in cell wall biosynthesis